MNQVLARPTIKQQPFAITLLYLSSFNIKSISELF